ncbi:MAG: ImmA/IrrE family metallo-endopeptidase [Pyrinomonadaceae bacterium]
MLLLADTISRLRIPWNRRPLIEADFHRLCRKHNVTVTEMPLKVSGFYYCAMGRHFIAIDSRLSPQKKLFVMFHEFAHYLLHAPSGTATANYHGVGKRTRAEFEADSFALCALMPIVWVESDRFAELASDAGYDEEMTRDRLAVFEHHSL